MRKISMSGDDINENAEFEDYDGAKFLKIECENCSTLVGKFCVMKSDLINCEQNIFIDQSCVNQEMLPLK